MYNPYAVSNSTPTDPLEVFKLPPDVIQAIQQAAKGLTVNVNNPAAPKPPATSGVTLPGSKPSSPAPAPAPQPAPAPAPSPAPAPTPPGTVNSTVNYPGLPGNPGDPSNTDMGTPIPGGPPINEPPPSENDPSGTANSTVNTGPGYWTQDANGNPVWVPGPNDLGSNDPGSSTTLDPANQYPPDVPIDPSVPIQNDPSGPYNYFDGGGDSGGGAGGGDGGDAAPSFDDASDD